MQDKVLSIDEQLVVFQKRQDELFTITEQQSQVIKELAEQNQKLILALRGTRILAVVGLGLALAAVVVVFIV